MKERKWCSQSDFIKKKAHFDLYLKLPDQSLSLASSFLCQIEISTGKRNLVNVIVRFTGRLTVCIVLIVDIAVVLGFALKCLSFRSPSLLFSLFLLLLLLLLLLFIINLFKFMLTENLALKKTAEQSSRQNDSSGAENAVDGNRNPLFDANGNCALTKQGDPSWWRVDLGTYRVPVSDVFIVNRLFPSSALQTNGYYKITLGEK